ncbi:Uncharacterised protein [Yersinia intermedia]|nr:Uncharacterised protein [Yersinia intermedia]
MSKIHVIQGFTPLFSQYRSIELNPHQVVCEYINEYISRFDNGYILKRYIEGELLWL